MNVIVGFCLVIATVLGMVVAGITWEYWPELKAAYKWSQVQKAHRLEEQRINRGKNSMLGSRSKSKNS